MCKRMHILSKPDWLMRGSVGDFRVAREGSEALLEAAFDGIAGSS